MNKRLALPDGKSVDIERLMDFYNNPQKYMSYKKLVKEASIDIRPPKSPFMRTAFGGEPVSIPELGGNYYIFKINGADIHKDVSALYLHISAILLAGYGKTPDEFIRDWETAHPDD